MSAIVSATIQNVVVSDRTVWWHVLLETDDGFTGIGEATHQPVADGFAARFQAAANRFIGRRLADCMASIGFMRTGDLERRSIHSALSQAVSDLTAQQQGVPLHNLLGNTFNDVVVPLYANINRASRDRLAETFAKNAAAAVQEGFGAVKIAPFDDLTPDLCGTQEGLDLINLGLDRLAAVAQAANGADIMVDCHWRFSPVAALSAIPTLKEIGVCWFECPLQETTENIADLVKLRHAANDAGIRLSGLETFGGWADAAPFLKAGAYDVAMPDVKHTGSLKAIVELADRAAEHGVTVSLHNPSGPVAHFYSEQVSAVIDGGERLEVQWRESPLFFELTDPPPDLSDGVCRPSSGPGLGASLVDRPETETAAQDATPSGREANQ